MARSSRSTWWALGSPSPSAALTGTARVGHSHGAADSRATAAATRSSAVAWSYTASHGLPAASRRTFSRRARTPSLNARLGSHPGMAARSRPASSSAATQVWPVGSVRSSFQAYTACRFRAAGGSPRSVHSLSHRLNPALGRPSRANGFRRTSPGALAPHLSMQASISLPWNPRRSNRSNRSIRVRSVAAARSSSTANAHAWSGSMPIVSATSAGQVRSFSTALPPYSCHSLPAVVGPIPSTVSHRYLTTPARPWCPCTQ